jgi:DNA-binding MarR family transcriptional regulator
MNLQQTNRVIEAALEEHLQARANLSWPEFELLWRLQIAAEHPLRMNEIADQLLGSPSGVTRMADRLEKDGLISRETPKENRRIVHVRLTERGRGVLAEARRVFADTLGDTFSAHLSDAEVGSLRRLMRKLLEGNGAWEDHRCEPGLGR